MKNIVGCDLSLSKGNLSKWLSKAHQVIRQLLRDPCITTDAKWPQ